MREIQFWTDENFPDFFKKTGCIVEPVFFYVRY